MKQPSRLLRFATISCSLLLVGGCVSYRAGLFKDRQQGKAAVESSPAVPVREKEDMKELDHIPFGSVKAPLRGSIID